MRKEEAEQHLAECAACRAQLEETQKIMALCRDMSEVPLPEGFSERLHERLMREAKPKRMPMFRLQQYKRGFAIGAAVVAASMVFVATPFFRLYNESGNVPHIAEENTIPNAAKEVPQAESEEPRETPTVTAAGAETEIGEEPRQTAKPIAVTEEPQATTPIRQAETVPEVQSVQPAEQPITTAEPQSVQKADTAEPITATEPSVQDAKEQPEIGIGGAVPFMASRGGGGGAAAVNAEPTFAVLADTAENRAWVRENVSGYDSRISADGAEIVTLTEDEYLTCLYDGPETAADLELPQAVTELLEADGYYLILK